MRNNNLFYGTWELDGVLKNIDEKTAIKLLKYAKSKGIDKFDTAIVYGNGKVEKMLSAIVEDDDEILTKVPAIVKPSIDAVNISEYYPEKYIEKKVNESLKNLNRESIDIVLLHNWSTNWEEDLMPLHELKQIKDKGIVKKIGISLPNNYNKRLPDKIIKMIDYIEAPYNIDEKWILNDINYYRQNNIEIILRSLFKQGTLLKENLVSVKETILFIKKLDVFVTIGMTSKDQIDENIKLLGEKYEK